MKQRGIPEAIIHFTTKRMLEQAWFSRRAGFAPWFSKVEIEVFLCFVKVILSQFSPKQIWAAGEFLLLLSK